MHTPVEHMNITKIFEMLKKMLKNIDDIFHFFI